MLPVLPYHSLVFCSEEQSSRFPEHERLSHEAIAYDLVGHRGEDLSVIITEELRHRAELKLSLGQRVAVPPTERHLASAALAQGAYVFDVSGSKTFQLAMPIQPLRLHERWKGITIIGDAHGDLRALTAALRWAEGRQHFVWFLGDVIDYGKDTLATIELAYRTVMAGNGGMILGNHERKIARWLTQSETGKPHLRLNDGNRVTIEAWQRLKGPTRAQWTGRFRSLLAHASLLQQIDNCTLLHAAAHPSLWEAQQNTDMIEQYALYGEGDQTTGKFRRLYRWVDAVPGNQIVFVGHDVISEFPLIMRGAKGGQAVFLDTGCGTGGYLSSADLRFSGSNLRLECFHRH